MEHREGKKQRQDPKAGRSFCFHKEEEESSLWREGGVGKSYFNMPPPLVNEASTTERGRREEEEEKWSQFRKAFHFPSGGRGGELERSAPKRDVTMYPYPFKNICQKRSFPFLKSSYEREQCKICR